jgi:hypothetical protein
METKVKHPAVQAFIDLLPEMPRLLEERRRRIREKREFQRRVFEKALTEARLIGPNARRKVWGADS